MIDITLSAIPNQTVAIRLEDRQYSITVQETRGVMSATITRDDVLIVSGMRMVAGSPIIPYQYLENGNFVVITENDELPDYTLFGNTQSMVYVSTAEPGLVGYGR